MNERRGGAGWDYAPERQMGSNRADIGLCMSVCLCAFFGWGLAGTLSQSRFRPRAKQNMSPFSGGPLPGGAHRIRPKTAQHCVLCAGVALFSSGIKMLSCLASLGLLLSPAAGKTRLLYVIGICAQWTQPSPSSSSSSFP